MTQIWVVLITSEVSEWPSVVVCTNRATAEAERSYYVDHCGIPAKDVKVVCTVTLSYAR